MENWMAVGKKILFVYSFDGHHTQGLFLACQGDELICAQNSPIRITNQAARPIAAMRITQSCREGTAAKQRRSVAKSCRFKTLTFHSEISVKIYHFT